MTDRHDASAPAPAPALLDDPDALRAAATTSKAWPFVEARRLAHRYPDGKPGGAPVRFETGYGPSGLPHIGTFCEVLRTTMVRHAYEQLTGGAPTELIAFSDDLDGLRKVPDNVPGQAMLAEHLGRPLSAIPDPFGTHDSFAAHNNAMLRDFLDRFGFEYSFMSATERYRSGAFDDALRAVLRNHDAIMDVMLPTLRAERRATYAPVLPISPVSGRVLQVPIDVVDADAGTIGFDDPDAGRVEQSALGGEAKLQWKVDWAMRWVALGIDYEMYGKDLTDSGTQSGRIARILGGARPEGIIYEMFLDERGEKISKSKGNGLTMEQWLSVGSPESLAFYAYREPKAAKQLHAGVIPRAVDDYQTALGAYATQPIEQRLGNAVHHIHHGHPPVDAVPPIAFGLLLNLVGVLGAQADEAQVRAYLANYLPGDEAARVSTPMIEAALAYHRTYVAPSLARRAPTVAERGALMALDAALATVPDDADAEALQGLVYAVGKDERHGFAGLRDWFQALYETLLGTSQGPRMGSFIRLYGIGPTRRLIAEALARDASGAAA